MVGILWERMHHAHGACVSGGFLENGNAWEIWGTTISACMMGMDVRGGEMKITMCMEWV